jgi:hypothetical protein
LSVTNWWWPGSVVAVNGGGLAKIGIGQGLRLLLLILGKA